MRYDRGYGRDFQAGRGGGYAPLRGYDYGLRGYHDTAPERAPVRMRYVGGQGGGYDRGYHGRPPFPNRVTQRYNMEYLHPQPNQLRTNYVPFGGDVDERIVDSTGYWRPYSTQGGSSTWRGGGQPMGWEREGAYARYDREFRGYGRDFQGPMR
jgi:hypothetical protein